jgi:hypothetical protein
MSLMNGLREAFAEFSKSRLPERVHETFIKKSYACELVGHNSRDSTAILALSLSAPPLKV